MNSPFSEETNKRPPSQKTKPSTHQCNTTTEELFSVQRPKSLRSDPSEGRGRKNRIHRTPPSSPTIQGKTKPKNKPNTPSRCSLTRRLVNLPKRNDSASARERRQNFDLARGRDASWARDKGGGGGGEGREGREGEHKDTKRRIVKSYKKNPEEAQKGGNETAKITYLTAPQVELPVVDPLPGFTLRPFARDFEFGVQGRRGGVVVRPALLSGPEASSPARPIAPPREREGLLRIRKYAQSGPKERERERHRIRENERHHPAQEPHLA
jgi:hypothetical protein